MIEFQNVSKQYGNKKALDHLNLKIKDGEIFGFLGHNGAGKSTTIKSLVSVIEPTEGQILINDQKLQIHRQVLKKKIGYVPDTPDLFLQLSASEYWDLIGAAFELSAETKNERLKKLLDLFELTDKQDETISSFSHGMRQKTIVIGALLSDPDIWILDEPMQGLDPQAAHDLKQLMKEHAQKGKTVVFSTHDLATAQQLCDELAILKKGKLIYNGTLEDLMAQYPGESLEDIYLGMAGRKAQLEEGETGE